MNCNRKGIVILTLNLPKGKDSCITNMLALHGAECYDKLVFLVDPRLQPGDKALEILERFSAWGLTMIGLQTI